MKSSNFLVAVRTTTLAVALGVIAAPMFAQAQAGASAPVTRAQVQAELAALIAAGYNPSDRNHYPENLWAAQRRVEQQRSLASGQATPQQTPVATLPPAVSNESVGGVADSTSASGSRPRAFGPQPMCDYGATCNIFRGR
ncbi:DUF4148 domain-containing protein [bacterium]|nr:MAG: DUF4148 domain-containing protein [bacterium]